MIKNDFNGMYRVLVWFVVINFDVIYLNVLLCEIINVFLNKLFNYEKKLNFMMIFEFIV